MAQKELSILPTWVEPRNLFIKKNIHIHIAKIIIVNYITSKNNHCESYYRLLARNFDVHAISWCSLTQYVNIVSNDTLHLGKHKQKHLATTALRLLEGG